MSAAAEVRRGDRFALFWGGGLGDVMVARPLLMALAARLEHRPYFFTTASHLEGLFEALGLDVELHVLPSAPGEALRRFRSLEVKFDWIYLGPRPRIKTRMLARIVGAKRIWSVRHADTDPFLGDQILADVRALGLAGTDPRTALPYGGDWGPPAPPSHGPYLVLHAGAKGRWETKQWPEQKWTTLLDRLLDTTGMELLLVGTPAERSMLEASVQGRGARVRVQTGFSLPELAASLRGSRGVICHNSGVMHLAALLGKPTVVLTGSSPRHWRPPYAHVLNLDSGRCGLACDQYRCPVPFYHARCIRELDVETVMHAVQARLLGNP